MTTDWERIGRLTGDPVSNVLKWILLAVAVVTFAMLGWMTGLIPTALNSDLCPFSRSD